MTSCVPFALGSGAPSSLRQLEMLRRLHPSTAASLTTVLATVISKSPFLPGAVGDALQQVNLCPCERFACLHLADGLLDGVGSVDFRNGVGLLG